AGEPEVSRPLEFSEAEIATPRAPTIRLMLPGAHPHYARYAEVGGSGARITCGLGGAYLMATHRLPEQLEVPSPASRMHRRTEPRRYSLAARYPDQAESAALAPGILRLGWRNPGSWAVLGVMQTLLAVALAFAVD